MKLSVLERVKLMQILPLRPEDNFITYKIITNLKMELSFNEKEYKDVKMVEKEGQIFWSKNIDKEIEIGEKAKSVIAVILKKLDEQNKITDDLGILYEKFVETIKT